MNRSARENVRSVPLRAVIVFVFLLMTSFQPGLFAFASTSGTEPATAAQEVHSAHSHSGKQNLEDASAETHQHGSKHYHGSGESADKSCEVSCAPSVAVLVEYLGLLPSTERSYAAEAVSALETGETVDLIRPPRS